MTDNATGIRTMLARVMRMHTSQPKRPRCEFVGNGLQCMRYAHTSGTHATGSPLPHTVWDGQRWSASAEFVEGTE